MFIHTVMKWRLKIKECVVTHCIMLEINIQFFQSTCLLGPFTICHDCASGHAHVHTCSQGCLENSHGLSSCPLYHKLYFTFCFLCSASRRSSALNGAALGTPGSFLGFLRPRFLASFLTFRWCSLIWRQEQEYFLSLRQKRKGTYPS